MFDTILTLLLIVLSDFQQFTDKRIKDGNKQLYLYGNEF